MFLLPVKRRGKMTVNTKLLKISEKKILKFLFNSIIDKVELLKKIIFIILILMGVCYLFSYTRNNKILISEKIEIQKEKQEEPADKTPERIEIILRTLPPENTIEKKRTANKKSMNNISKYRSVPEHLQYIKAKSLIDSGKQFLGKNGLKVGSFPVINVNYRKFLGINEYLKEMQRIGGRFYIMNLRTGTIADRVNFAQKQLVPKGSLEGLSPRSRLIEKEPSMSKYIKNAENKYGKGNYAVILLVPLKIEQYIIGAINDAASRQGCDIKMFSSFNGLYIKKNKILYLGINKGVLKNNDKKPLNISIALSL